MQRSANWKWPLRCSRCGDLFPEGGFPHCCPQCGSLFEFKDDLLYDPRPMDSCRSGLERFRNSFPLPPDADFISLGEGNTPLIESQIEGRSIYFKCEHLNPTGSFKDRGAAVLVSALKHAGIEGAVEDSSGNAGASFAAYAAHAGLKAKIFIPDYASGPKRRQIEAYGAEVVSIPSPRSAATEAVLKAVQEGAVYASHAYLPHGIAGMATVAYELLEQLNAVPGSIITPVGQGTLLLGLAMGFRALLNAAEIHHQPHLFAIQSKACAPIWVQLKVGEAELSRLKEEETVAEGIRILNPLRADGVISAIRRSHGDVIAVEEDEILKGWEELGRRGFYVEPTSSVVWGGLQKAWDQLRDPVVVMLTGAGLKSFPR